LVVAREVKRLLDKEAAEHARAAAAAAAAAAQKARQPPPAPRTALANLKSKLKTKPK